MSENYEKTFILIKPDGVQRGFIGRVINKFEDKGLKLLAMKMIWPKEDIVSQHYIEHIAKPFFQANLRYMTSGPVVVMVWQGFNCVKICRQLVGQLDPDVSTPGTIRGDLRCHIRYSIAHSSDSVEAAANETRLWFPEGLECNNYSS